MRSFQDLDVDSAAGLNNFRKRYFTSLPKMGQLSYICSSLLSILTGILVVPGSEVIVPKIWQTYKTPKQNKTKKSLGSFVSGSRY